jgi:predicted DNA-binding protein YlxM (UPF0122 family)
VSQGTHWLPEKVHSLCVLMDAYEGLLPPRQHQVMRLKLHEDLSLSEIAESLGTSRQACEDALKRAEKALLAFEQMLGLVRKTDACRDRFEELLRLLSGMGEDNWKDAREQAIDILRDAVLGGEPEDGV